MVPRSQQEIEEGAIAMWTWGTEGKRVLAIDLKPLAWLIVAAAAGGLWYVGLRVAAWALAAVGVRVSGI